MSHFKSWRLLIVLCLLFAGCVPLPSLESSAAGQVRSGLLRALGEASVLARIELSGPPDALGLPVYAHLQDAAGKEYVLVIASQQELDGAGIPYTVLDTGGAGSDYILALPRRAEEARPAGELVKVLYDDGRQLVARATPDAAEALAVEGFDIQRLDDSPIIWQQAAVRAMAPEALTFDPRVAGMVASIQSNELYDAIGRLSGEWPATVGGVPYTIVSRHTTSGEPLMKATQYVYERMQAFNLNVSYHHWTLGTYTHRNVVGEWPGTTRPDEVVLVVAHLDNQPLGAIARGADDNASGSVGLLAAVEALSQYRFQRTLRFILFTGEEQGMLGSKVYAEEAYNAGQNIVAVYNMDMIGFNTPGSSPVVRIHTRPNTNPGHAGDLELANLFADAVQTYGLGTGLVPVIDADGLSFSDHSPFWNKGYSAILAIEDDVNDWNPRYHTVNDALQYIDMAYFTHFVKSSVATIAHLSGVPPLLHIEAAAWPDPVAPGGCLTYTLAITNTAGPATGVSVTDTLPADTTFVAASHGGSLSGGNVRWSGLSLGTGESIKLTAVVAVGAVPEGSKLVNANYTVSAAEAPEPVAGIPVETTVKTLLGLTLAPASAMRLGNPGSLVTYTLSVSNTGNISETFEVAIASAWPVTAPPTLGPLEPGTGTLLPVVVDVPAGILGDAEDTATVVVRLFPSTTVTATATLRTVRASEWRYIPMITR